MKNKLKLLLILLLALALTVFSFACGPALGREGYSPAGKGAFDYDYKELAPSGGTVSDAEGGEGATDDFDGSGSINLQQSRPAGLITASAWNDNEHYDYFLSMFKKAVSESGQGTGQDDGASADGKFVHYLENDSWGFDATKRVTVKATFADGTPVQGATVSYYTRAQTERSSVTDANGYAYAFPTDDEGEVTVKFAAESIAVPYTAENRDLNVAFGGSASKVPVIRLMFVVDVTGSMGDELSYLKNELTDIVARIATKDSVRIELALLFYRDNGDAQKFAYYDFVTVTEGSGLNSQLRNISVQTASGGGDYPEALDEALELAAGKNWGDDNSTRVLFHVFDAPPHSKEYNRSCFDRAVKTLSSKGIRYNPVLCSGANDLCEYLGRMAAIYTAGHFVYVTDDSGIGYAHHDPGIPNAVVERLNDLIVRMVDGYYTGTFAEPVEWRSAAFGDSVVNAAYEYNTYQASIEGYRAAEVVTSSAALKAMDERLGGQFLGAGSYLYNSRLSTRLREYDNNFFNEKKLLYVAVTYPDKSADLGLKGITLESSDIVVNLSQTAVPGETEQAIRTFIFVIEINKNVGGDTLKVNID